MLTGVIPSPRFLPAFFIAHRVQQSHCLSIVHRVLLTHALALSANQFVVHNKKTSARIYTSMHSAGLGLAKLTFTRLEDNLIRHRGDHHAEYRVPKCVVVIALAASQKSAKRNAVCTNIKCVMMSLLSRPPRIL